MNQDERYIEIEGTVKSILFQNEENGYTVARLETVDGDSITAVGCLPCVNIGVLLSLKGERISHPTYGEQFKVDWAEVALPTGAEAIYDFLSARAIRGVGPATATLLVSKFGGRTLEVIENEPERLAEVRGISRKKAHEISETFKKQVVIRRLMELLSNYSIKPVYAIRLYRVFGDEASKVFRENPYIITMDSIGANFSDADRCAIGEGFEGDSPERVAAAALYELKHNTRNGHCFIPAETLVSVTCTLIDVPAEPVEDALEMLIDSGELVRTPIAGRVACYLTSLYEAEVYSADRIRSMASKRPESIKDLSGLIKDIELEQSIEYAGLQIYSLQIAASHQIMALTGGPGTGKTTTVRAIVALYERLGLETLLTAPTGRAAKRMGELTGKNAVTVHRLLEAGMVEGSDETVFRKNENDLLKCDAVILDECSMVDITLFRALLCAIPKESRLVLVGDADQLPSVGPGNVFSDIIRSGIVETVRLTEIFRQTASSRIVANAHLINRGDYPDLNSNNGESDFFFLRRSNLNHAIETVVELCASRLPGRMGIPPVDIQVLSPTRKGETGTRNLNSVLQSALNGPGPGKKEKKFGEITFRQGDRVMQIRNNYDIIWYKNDSLAKEDADTSGSCPGEAKGGGTGVYNGDVGIITDIDEEKEFVSVLYDDRLALYGYDLLPELEHAFAMTVHKAQGSEYRAVILLALDGAPQLMSRRILYTAVTRAKQLLVIVGNDGTVYHMIDNHRSARRYSGLRARLTEEGL